MTMSRRVASTATGRGAASAGLIAGDLRNLGAAAEDEAALRAGLEQHPVDLELMTAFADLAFREKHWDDAASRYQAVLDTHGDSAQPAIYLRLNQAHQARLANGAAEAAIRKGLDRFPNDLSLMTAWADLARKVADWEQARYRYEAVLRVRGANARPRDYERLAAACRRVGESFDAEAAIRVGLNHYPGDLPLLTMFAELAFRAMNWDDALSRFRTVMNASGEEVTADVFLRLAQSLRMTGEVENADAVMARGLAAHPGNLMLLTRYPWQQTPPVLVTKIAKAHWRWGLYASDTFALEVECLKRLERQAGARIHFPRLHSANPKTRELTMEFKGVALKCLAEVGIRPDVADPERQVETIMQALEDASVIHLDLQPDNIVVDDNGVVSIIDFGISIVDDRPMTSLLATVPEDFRSSGGYRLQREQLKKYLSEMCSLR